MKKTAKTNSTFLTAYYAYKQMMYNAEIAFNTGATEYKANLQTIEDGRVSIEVKKDGFKDFVDFAISFNTDFCTAQMLKDGADVEILFKSKTEAIKTNKLKFVYHQKTIVTNFISRYGKE
jgi:hypothetical protein